MIIKFPKNNCWGVYSFLIDNFYSYMKNFGFLKINHIWGIERSGFFNGREKWVKGFESQMI